MRKLTVFFLTGFLFSTAVWSAGKLPADGIRLKGEKKPGALLIGKVPAGSKVSLNGRALHVSAEGDFVFGLDRDARSGDRVEAVFPDGTKHTEKLQLAARKYHIQRVEGVPADIQSPQKSEETWARIKAETDMVKAARKKDLPLLDFREAFRWPLIGPITGVFGSQRVYNGEPGRPHYGVDIAAPVGTRVKAPADGIVTLAHDNMYYSGGTLIIDHGFGVSSTFIHLSKILVHVGDNIHQGDEVAEVGATGRASGPHLDWRMNWFNRRIDPQMLVPAMPEK